MDWRETLLEEGYIEVGNFRIELTLDNTFLDIDYIPRVAIYSKETGRWYVLRNPIERGNTLSEGWKNAVAMLERICAGEEPLLPDEDVARRFSAALRTLCRAPHI